MQQLLDFLLAAPERLRPYWPHLTALAVALVIGVGAGLLSVAATVPTADTADRWPLPKWAPYRASTKREAMKQPGIWAVEPGKEKVDVAKKPEGPSWKFIGTVQGTKGRIAVIEIDRGKRTQLIPGGQLLPNGALIKNVGVGDLTYEEDGIEKVLRLFNADKTANLPPENRRN